MFRDAQPKVKIGWFLHTPFPSAEIYVTLPLRKELLRGVLAADLVAFHIYDYVRSTRLPHAPHVTPSPRLPLEPCMTTTSPPALAFPRCATS